MSGEDLGAMWAPTTELGEKPKHRRSRLDSCSTAAPSPRASLRGSFFGQGRLIECNEDCESSFSASQGTLNDCGRSARGSVSMTPPRTPSPPARQRTPSSPPPAPRPAPCPPLLKALRAGSVEQVHLALRDDPEAASLPFFDHSMETPLCCAVRFHCGVHILRLLLEHGADVNADDLHGRTPLAILCSATPQGAQLESFPLFVRGHNSGGSYLRNNVAAAHVLLEAGANPLLRDASGTSAIDSACDSGNDDLLQLLSSNGFADEVQRARNRVGPPGPRIAWAWGAPRLDSLPPIAPMASKHTR